MIIKPEGFIVEWKPFFANEKRLYKAYSVWFRLFPIKYAKKGFALISPVVSNKILDNPFCWIEESQIEKQYKNPWL